MPHGRSAKRRRLTPPIDDEVSETIQAGDLFHRAADWDLEQDYEKRNRQNKGKESRRLPIKTSEGRIEIVQEEVVSEDDNDKTDSFLGSGSEDEDGQETPPTDIPEKYSNPTSREQIIAAKEELARLAGLINEDPEEHAGSFKKLAQFSESQQHPSIRKLALATQVAVYKDVIPGYRIRNYQDEDLGSKVSKDIRRTRQYEQSLVSGYRNFVNQLTDIAKSRASGEEDTSLRSVAINCVCALLQAVPHFNFRTELLNVMVHVVSSRKASVDFYKCVETFELFFEADEEGAASFEAVGLLTKMIKAKDYRVREDILNSFFHLRLLSELSRESLLSKAERQDSSVKLHGRKVKKETREHRSKKEKKLARERKAVEKDMREADAVVSHEERERLQSETLKLVFATYFRILKARTPHLMGAVLEGLAKHAHLINQDLFGDLIEALRDIVDQADGIQEEGEDLDESQRPPESITYSRNRSREALLATQTAFTLLSRQEVSKSASDLHLDLSFFTARTYRNLYPLALDADLELGSTPLHLSDPFQPHGDDETTLRRLGKTTINLATPTLLLTRILTSILLPTTPPPPTPTTSTTFFKRLLTASIHTPEKSSLAFLALLQKLIESKYVRVLEPLWYSDERKGDGVFNGASESVEGTRVLCVGSGAWEGELLRRHYVPGVREGWREVEKVVRGRQGGR